MTPPLEAYPIQVWAGRMVKRFGLPRAEIEQHARCLALEARAGYNPAKGAWETYLWRVLQRQLPRWCVKQVQPAHVSKHATDRGVRTYSSGDLPLVSLAAPVDADTLLTQAQVRARVVQLSAHPAVAAVLLYGLPVPETARRIGLKQWTLRTYCREARERLQNDAVLRQHWEQL